MTVSKAPAVFDLDKLNWLNGHYIRQSDLDYITNLCLPHLQQAGYLPADPKPEDVAMAKQVVAATRDYLANISEIVDHVAMFYADEVTPENDQAKEALMQEQVPQVMHAMKQKVLSTSELTEEIVKKMLKELTKELGFGGKKVYMPLRVALTGQTHGPELYQIIPILGTSGTVARLNAVLSIS